jgi:hypothetical protein
LQALRRLRLEDNPIDDDVVDVLATSPIDRFEQLTMDDTYLSDQSRAALESLHWPEGALELVALRESSTDGP